ncbi:unnamed protein product [Parnassius apollo]|uniref:(apollo) hypothetical protein n=1 Tax=Parnassius apollo TaxID=110799 RepID=A0A8S3X4S1_PARAO|nr:unnamed protein product [Parnassius apollo]
MESDGDSATDREDSLTRVPAKRKRYKQKFREEWLLNKEYSDWLRKDNRDLSKAVCNVCNTSFSAEISVIKHHKEGTKHVNNLKRCSASTSKKQQSIVSVFKSMPTNEKQLVKTSEIKLAAFVAEHKVSHNVMNHLADLLPKLFPDSQIAKDIRLKRTKVQAVINNCIGETEKENLISDLKSQMFSILIDESTDIAVVKTVAVVVRYFDPMIGKVITRFWNLIQLFDEKTTDHVANAEKLFNTVIGSFQKYEIPTENIIGFGSDGCNTMMGCNNSVSSRFRQRCPGIIVIKCICHSLHLCASDACKELPLNCEKMARNIYNYFKSSSKRQSELKEFQYFAEADVHKILRPAQTRWLSLNAVVQRILEQWDVLRLYFNSKWLEESECHDIHACLNDPIIKAYYYFLAWMLPKFTTLNSCFQSESILITKLHGKMTAFYKELLLLVLHRNYVNSAPIETIDPMTEINHKDLKDIYLGLGVQKELDSVENEERKLTLRKMCKNFIIRACVGLRKRYCFNDKIMTEIAKFDLEKVISDDREESVSSLFPLLPRIAPTSIQHQQELDDEWRKLPLYYKDLDLSQPPDVFWHQIIFVKMMSRGKKLVSLVAVNCEKVSENEQSSHAGLVDIQEIQSTSYNNADAIDFHHSQIHGEDSDDNVETELESLFGDVSDADDPTYRLPIFSHQLENENSNNLVTLEDLLGNKENFNAEKFDVEHIQNNIEVFDQGYEQHREITAIIEDILDEVFKKAWLLIEPLKRWRKSDPSSWVRNVVKKRRADGLPYKSKANIRPAKVPKEIDCSKCQFKCTDVFDTTDRDKFCRFFWNLDFLGRKNFILANVTIQMPKRVLCA